MSLPDKISALLRVALADVEKCDADPVYVLDMNRWHDPIKTPAGPVCAVCMAGAVMAQTLKISPDNHATPEEYGEQAESFLDGELLDSLNDIRIGNLAGALYTANQSVSSGDSAVLEYLETRIRNSVFLQEAPDPEHMQEWLKEWREIATELEQAGY